MQLQERTRAAPDQSRSSYNSVSPWRNQQISIIAIPTSLIRDLGRFYRRSIDLVQRHFLSLSPSLSLYIPQCCLGSWREDVTPERWMPCVAGPDSVHIRQAINPIPFSGQTDTHFNIRAYLAMQISGPVRYRISFLDLLICCYIVRKSWR